MTERLQPDEILFRRDGVDPSQWPKLSCSAANQLALEFSNLTLEGNREIAFQGNGLLRITGDLRILTGNPATEKLTILANGNVGMGESNPATKLVVNGNLKLQQGFAINEFSNDPNLTDNTDLAVPTEKAVKSYVDAKITQVKTALSTKATVSGDATQDFQTKNLTVQGNLDVIGTTTANKFVGDGSGLIGLAGTTQWVNGASGSISYSGGNVGIGTTTPQGKLEVSGDIRAGNSDIYFTKTDHNHSGIGNTPGWAAIENSTNYGALMILGRNQGTGGSISRIVKLWDYLQVNGDLDVTGNISGRVTGIGFAFTSVQNGQMIPAPSGFTRQECVFFASIKYLNFRRDEDVLVNVTVDATGKVAASPEGKVVAIGVAIGKKGGW